MTTRVRFAPSPTGYLHLGGLRTALFNYLFAARKNGKLILRIEDTDQTRYVPGSVEYLQDIFKWLGLRFDESPFKGGAHSPYIQSQRLSIYREYAQDLIKKGGAYRCFCSKERLAFLRSQVTTGQRKGYDGFCRELSEKEVRDKLQLGTPHVIRLKVPLSGVTTVNDIVYGDVSFNNQDIDDQILLKTDGYPTYHLANVVDDHVMEISHVLRGEEWLSSTCKHKLLYTAFDWMLPVFCHIPLLTNMSGSKLSKRSVDVHIQSYKDKGYTPEGLLNFVALQGWNSGTEKEIYTLQELIESFSLSGINKSSSAVDNSRLDWINSVHVKRLIKDHERMNQFVNDLQTHLLSQKCFGLTQDNPLLESGYLRSIINLIQERTCLIPKIPNQAPYFWVEPKPRTEKLKSFPNSVCLLEKLLEVINEYDFTKTGLSNSLEVFKPTNIKSLIRECVTGGMGGPDIIETMIIIGKERSIQRIQKGIAALQ